MRLLRSLIILGLFCAASAVQAQTTSWGDPDLQGVWSKQTPVPLERPAAIAKKPFFSKQEAADLEKNALAVTLKGVAAGIPTSGEFNEIYLESEKGRVHPNLRTSLIVDPPDGRIPFTPEGRLRWLATPDLLTERITGNTLTANSWHDRALQERCITSDAMFFPNAFYNNYHRIVQAPGYVVIVTEAMHDVRVIKLDPSTLREPQGRPEQSRGATGSGSPGAESSGDRRPRLGAGVRQWVGDSRGWWEGKTLVVETANFNDQRRFLGSTKDVRLVERFTRTDHNTINYSLTVTDPRTYSRPWTLENMMWRSDEPMFEVGCHEGNIGLAAILSGARTVEKR